jgi:hypothetical protein
MADKDRASSYGYGEARHVFRSQGVTRETSWDAETVAADFKAPRNAFSHQMSLHRTTFPDDRHQPLGARMGAE